MTRPLHAVVALTAMLSVGVGCSDDEGSNGVDGDEGSIETVSIDGNAFEPAEITVALSAEVEWANEDSATHTVTADDDATFASEQLTAGDSFQHVFEEPGEYAYHCEIHPFMHGTIIVE